MRKLWQGRKALALSTCLGVEIDYSMYKLLPYGQMIEKTNWPNAINLWHIHQKKWR